MVATDGYDRLDGAVAMTRLLDLPEPPDAVFAYNDLVALGALRVLAERACGCPRRSPWWASTTSRRAATAPSP